MDKRGSLAKYYELSILLLALAVLVADSGSVLASPLSTFVSSGSPEKSYTAEKVTAGDANTELHTDSLENCG